MAQKNIFTQKLAQALNIDALNRSFVAEVETENGDVFATGLYSGTEGESEVFKTVTPATGNLLNLWMAFEPEIVDTDMGDGRWMRNVDIDVRYFSIRAGKTFSGFLPKIGDILQFTKIAGAYTKGTSKFAIIVDGSRKLTWSDTAITDGLCLELLEETYESITDGSKIGGSQRIPAYKFQVKLN